MEGRAGLRGAAVATVITLALAGAFSQASPAVAQDKKLVIGASVPLLNDPAWVRIIDYAQFVAKQLDVTLDVVDAQGKEDKQINDIQSLLSKHIDALLFVPVSAANAPAIIRLANRAKVPAVATDRYPGFPADNPDNPYLTFVGPDNVECGRKIGEYLIGHGAKNFVGVEGTPGDANNQERTKGMHDAIAARAGEGVKMVQEIGALQTEDNGYQLMQNLLSAHPKGTVDGVFCYNDALCVGAYRAIKQAGRDKEMILGATDLNPQALDLIKAKTNYVYSIGGHWVMVGFATMIAYDYLHGHKPLSEFSRIEDVESRRGRVRQVQRAVYRPPAVVRHQAVHAVLQSKHKDPDSSADAAVILRRGAALIGGAGRLGGQPAVIMAFDSIRALSKGFDASRHGFGNGFKPADLAGKYIAYAALVVLIVFFGAMAPSVFLALGNFETILQNSAVQCVVAIGMTFVILIGSIDLSVGSNMALVGTLTALASKYVGGGAFFLAPVIGLAIGLVNAIVFVYGRIPSFVVTLGMLSVARGLVLIIGQGWPVPIPFSGLFADVGIPPVPFYIVVGLALLASFVLTKTAFGRYVFAIGGDEDKSRELGLPVDQVKVIVFAISGAMAGLGAESSPRKSAREARRWGRDSS